MLRIKPAIRKWQENISTLTTVIRNRIWYAQRKLMYLDISICCCMRQIMLEAFYVSLVPVILCPFIPSIYINCFWRIRTIRSYIFHYNCIFRFLDNSFDTTKRIKRKTIFGKITLEVSDVKALDRKVRLIFKND